MNWLLRPRISLFIVAPLGNALCNVLLGMPRALALLHLAYSGSA